MTVEVVALQPEHLDRLDPAYPIPQIPDIHLGLGATFLLEGEVAAICCLVSDGEVVEVGLVQSATRRLSPLAAHREAQAMIRGLRLQGHRRIRARPNSAETTRWLGLLGFEETETGVFELWL